MSRATFQSLAIPTTLPNTSPATFLHCRCVLKCEKSRLRATLRPVLDLVVYCTKFYSQICTRQRFGVQIKLHFNENRVDDMPCNG